MTVPHIADRLQRIVKLTEAFLATGDSELFAKDYWSMASSKKYLPTQSELDVRTEKKLAVNLAQLTIIGATPPLITALAHGAESQIAPVYKQK